MASPDDSEASIAKVLDDGQLRSQLFEAVHQDDKKKLHQILSSNSNGWRVKDEFGSSLLHHAAGAGRCGCLEYMLVQANEAIPVSGVNNRQCQPLHCAAYNGQVQAVQILLRKGAADTNAKNKEGETPLLAACSAGHFKVARVLLEHHCKENTSQQLPASDAADNTLLHLAVLGDHSMVGGLLQVMESLHYSKEDLTQLVKSTNKVNQTILHIAALQYQLPSVHQQLAQLQLTVDDVIKDKHGKTCGDYEQQYQQRLPHITLNQNGDVKDRPQSCRLKSKSPEPPLLESAGPNSSSESRSFLRTDSTDSRVTPSTDGIIPTGDPVTAPVSRRRVVHKDHDVDVHALRIDELQPGENHVLAIDPRTDSSQGQVELYCGLHGLTVNRLASDCHLIGPLVMIKYRYINRPVKVRVIIPHALSTSKNSKKHPLTEVKVFTVSVAAEVPEALPPSEYEIKSNNCVITTLINKQRMFAVAVMGSFAQISTKLWNSITLNPKPPPAIDCIYHVMLSEPAERIIVTVYCAINLPTTRKLLSNIRKKQPDASGTFVLSHEHIEISYQCTEGGRGWGVSHSPYKVNAPRILPSSQSELYTYPPSWEFEVTPEQNVNNVSDKVTCKMSISAGKTVLCQETFHHTHPHRHGSKLSNSVTTTKLLAATDTEGIELTPPIHYTAGDGIPSASQESTFNVQLTKSSSQESDV